MAKDTTSPFSPGRPVPVEFFIGRVAEIERLRRKVRDAISATRVEVAFLSGERGIGKSSLASFVRHLCEKDLASLGIHVMLGGVNTLEGVVKGVFDTLLKEQLEGTLFESIKGLFSKHVKEVGLFGISVEFAADAQELNSLANNFSTALRNLLAKVADKKKGILLILDDINGLAQSSTFANWLKSLVDEISVSGRPIPLAIVLVGLEERRRSLIGIQPSLARVFDPVEIRTWNRDESKDFFRKTFEKVSISCVPEALESMSRFAGGLPMLAHEIGDAAFAVDQDAVIDTGDALSGVVAAAEIVGHRYLDPLVYQSIRSERYRAILRRMVHEFNNERFTRSGMQKSLPDQEKKVFDNFLNKMKQLGVVVDDPDEGRGAYRFSNSLHHLYFFMEAQRAQQQNP